MCSRVVRSSPSPGQPFVEPDLLVCRQQSSRHRHVHSSFASSDDNCSNHSRRRRISTIHRVILSPVESVVRCGGVWGVEMLIGGALWCLNPSLGFTRTTGNPKLTI